MACTCSSRRLSLPAAPQLRLQRLPRPLCLLPLPTEYPPFPSLPAANQLMVVLQPATRICNRMEWNMGQSAVECPETSAML